MSIPSPTAPGPAPPFPAATVLAERLALILDSLAWVVKTHAGRHPASWPLLMMVWGRVRRLSGRFAALAARAAAGTLPPPRAPRRGATAPPPAQGPPSQGPPSQAPPSHAPPSPAPPSRPRLPSRLGWLGYLVGSDAWCCSSALCVLLEDPQMAALLALAPQAGRLLRPLCRMLVVDPVPLLGFPGLRTRRTRAPRAAPTARPARPAPPPAPAQAAPPPSPPAQAPPAQAPPAQAPPHWASGLPDALRPRGAPPRPAVPLWGWFFKPI